MNRTIKLAGFLLTTTAITACGGSETANGPLFTDPTDIDVAAVSATGMDSLSTAETFPILYSLVLQGDEEQASIQVGRGQLEVTGVDTVVLTRESGGTPITFTAVSTGETMNDTDYTATVDGETVTLNLNKGSGGTLAYFQGDTADNGFGFTGVYGFENVTAPTGTVVYNVAGLASAYVVEEGSPDAIVLTQDTATNPALTIAFGSGAVTGRLFDGTGMVSIEDDDIENDTLNVVVTIENGSFANGDITGNVSLSALVDLDTGGDQLDLAPTMDSSSVDARLYGNTGNVVAGTFESNGAFNLDGETFGTSVGGTFFTVGNPTPP